MHPDAELPAPPAPPELYDVIYEDGFVTDVVSWETTDGAMFFRDTTRRIIVLPLSRRIDIVPTHEESP